MRSPPYNREQSRNEAMNDVMTEDDLISQIGLLFGDCYTVKCVPSDYAKLAIKLVRDFDLRNPNTEEEYVAEA